MPEYPDIYVLRHGQTEWNKAGRFQGQLDSPLTELGVRQARQQGDILAGLKLDYAATSVFCSPLGRASRTAKLAGLNATPDPRLMEVAFGEFEGRIMHEVKTQIPNFKEGDGFTWHFQAPGGEGFDEMHARCLDFLNDLTDPTVIVAHGITSKVLRGIWLGIGLSEMGALPGGQGCVHRLNEDGQSMLDAPLG